MNNFDGFKCNIGTTFYNYLQGELNLLQLAFIFVQPRAKVCGIGLDNSNYLFGSILHTFIFARIYIVKGLLKSHL